MNTPNWSIGLWNQLAVIVIVIILALTVAGYLDKERSLPLSGQHYHTWRWHQHFQPSISHVMNIITVCNHQMFLISNQYYPTWRWHHIFQYQVLYWYCHKQLLSIPNITSIIIHYPDMFQFRAIDEIYHLVNAIVKV